MIDIDKWNTKQDGDHVFQVYCPSCDEWFPFSYDQVDSIRDAKCTYCGHVYNDQDY